MDKPIKIAVVNQKGGVGKTTTVVNLATALAAIDKQVLIVDLDPQGNATTGIGISKSTLTKSSYDCILHQADINDCVKSTLVPGMYVIPSIEDLSAAEIELSSINGRERHLQQALSSQCDQYDYILIDCPPSLGLLTLNALVAADYALIPLQSEFYALEGLAQLVSTIKRVRSSLNANLNILGILITMFDKRSSLNISVIEEVRKFFPTYLFSTVIPRNIKLSEAPSYGKPVLLYDHNCKGAQAYIEFAKELLRKLEGGYNAKDSRQRAG
ncbi:MAG: ParA family protein [Holosporales bacterium]|jgi:chromosome partitioning protein|nr:ParA family protein [Holosporales bacterium]